MPKPLRVFLCHSSNDKPVVRELYRRLTREAWIAPWLDEEQLLPGMDWSLEIEKAVEESDAILVCVSNNAVTKEGYIQYELRLVLDYANYKPEGIPYIFPVRLEACELPRRLRHLHYADYFPAKEKERGYERLLGGLRNRARALGISAENAEDLRRANRGPSGMAEETRGSVSSPKPGTHLPAAIPNATRQVSYEPQIFTIDRSTYDQVLDHARTHFPNMTVGFLLGTENHATMVVPCSNASLGNQRNRFLVTPEEYLKAELIAERHGLDIVGQFYSQDSGTAISEYTREWAQPFLTYLVIGMNTQPPSQRACRLTEDRTRFIDCKLSIE